MENTRLDLALVNRGLATTRTKAQDLINSGKVLVDGKIITKAGEKIGEESLIEVTEAEHPYVSRGGVKLEHGLKQFGLNVQGLTGLDIGLSTGGFTHCLLLHGAKKMIGVDVGTAQVAAALRSDARVQIFEQQDIREFDVKKIEPVDFFVADLSFISLTAVLPFIAKLLKPNSPGILLVKPQFELGRNRVKNGIVKSAAAHGEALKRVSDSARELGFLVKDYCASPITGGDGNQEFLLHVLWPQT